MEMSNELSVLGITPQTQSRLEVMGSVKAPENDEYDRTEPVTVTLPYGLLTTIRAALRTAVFGTIQHQAMAGMVASMSGQEDADLTTTEQGYSLERLMQNSLDIEDVLASAQAEVQAEGVTFSVPDSLPDDPEIWDQDPADFVEVDAAAKSEQDTTLD